MTFRPNPEQEQRDRTALKGACAADGRPATRDNPLVLSRDGWRIHRSHFTTPGDGFCGEPYREET